MWPCPESMNGSQCAFEGAVFSAQKTPTHASKPNSSSTISENVQASPLVPQHPLWVVFAGLSTYELVTSGSTGATHWTCLTRGKKPMCPANTSFLVCILRPACKGLWLGGRHCALVQGRVRIGPEERRKTVSFGPTGDDGRVLAPLYPGHAQRDSVEIVGHICELLHLHKTPRTLFSKEPKAAAEMSLHS